MPSMQFYCVTCELTRVTSFGLIISDHKPYQISEWCLVTFYADEIRFVGMKICVLCLSFPENYRNSTMRSLGLVKILFLLFFTQIHTVKVHLDSAMAIVIKPSPMWTSSLLSMQPILRWSHCGYRLSRASIAVVDVVALYEWTFTIP